jgi:hypothetical protein
MASRGFEVKERLRSRGLLIEERVRFGTGRPRKILKLSDKALRVLGLEARGVPAHHGGEEHVVVVGRVAEVLRRIGWSVEVEEGADVRAEKDGRRIAVEVETGRASSWGQLLRTSGGIGGLIGS